MTRFILSLVILNSTLSMGGGPKSTSLKIKHAESAYLHLSYFREPVALELSADRQTVRLKMKRHTSYVGSTGGRGVLTQESDVVADVRKSWMDRCGRVTMARSKETNEVLTITECEDEKCGTVGTTVVLQSWWFSSYRSRSLPYEDIYVGDVLTENPTTKSEL